VTLPRPRRHLKLSFQTMKTNQVQKQQDVLNYLAGMENITTDNKNSRRRRKAFRYY
jgi:hypothetical protein